MPQDLPAWAEPLPERPTPTRDRPFDRPDAPRDDRSDPTLTDPPAYDPTPPTPSVIWPPPGEDCGTCDVSGLTLVLDDQTIDCDEDPATCELTCCSFPAPNQCAPAYSEGPCAIPLDGEWFLIVVAIAYGVYRHLSG